MLTWGSAACKWLNHRCESKNIIFVCVVITSLTACAGSWSSTVLRMHCLACKSVSLVSPRLTQGQATLDLACRSSVCFVYFFPSFPWSSQRGHRALLSHWGCLSSDPAHWLSQVPASKFGLRQRHATARCACLSIALVITSTLLQGHRRHATASCACLSSSHRW